MAYCSAHPCASPYECCAFHGAVRRRALTKFAPGEFVNPARRTASLRRAPKIKHLLPAAASFDFRCGTSLWRQQTVFNSLMIFNIQFRDIMPAQTPKSTVKAVAPPKIEIFARERGGGARKTGVYTLVHEDLSTPPTKLVGRKGNFP